MIAKKDNYNLLENSEIEIGTNREWLNTLSDEEFAEQVIDVVKTCLFDFSKRSHWKLSVKAQEQSFCNWLKATKILHK